MGPILNCPVCGKHADGHMHEFTVSSQPAVAKMIGTDAATLQRIESGRMPSAETLRAILLFLLTDEAD